MTELTTANDAVHISAFFTEHQPVFEELKLTDSDFIVYPGYPAAENLLEQKVPPELRLIFCNDADDVKSTLTSQDTLRSPALLYVNGMDPVALRKAIQNSNITAIKCVIWVNSSNILSLSNLSMLKAYNKAKKETETLKELLAAKEQEL